MKIKRNNVHSQNLLVQWAEKRHAGKSLGPQTRCELQTGSPEESGRVSLAFIHSSDNILFALLLHARSWRNKEDTAMSPVVLAEPWFWEHCLLWAPAVGMGLYCTLPTDRKPVMPLVDDFLSSWPRVFLSGRLGSQARWCGWESTETTGR